MRQSVKTCKHQGEGGTALVLNHVSAREGDHTTHYVLGDRKFDNTDITELTVCQTDQLLVVHNAHM